MRIELGISFQCLGSLHDNAITGAVIASSLDLCACGTVDQGELTFGGHRALQQGLHSPASRLSALQRLPVRHNHAINESGREGGRTIVPSSSFPDNRRRCDAKQLAPQFGPGSRPGEPTPSSAPPSCAWGGGRPHRLCQGGQQSHYRA